MTRVCLVGASGVNLKYELLSHETSREAVSTYTLEEPFANTVAMDTVSLGAAVSLLNDLNWYLVRYVDEAMVLEPSISDDEWLSRALARAVRDDDLDPDETDRHLKIYGLVPTDHPDSEAPPEEESQSDDPPEIDGGQTEESRLGLVDPMYVARTGPDLPEYDLREVTDTLVLRITESEFGV